MVCNYRLFNQSLARTQKEVGLVVAGDGENVIACPGRAHKTTDASIVAVSDINRCLELGKRRDLLRFPVGSIAPEFGASSRADDESEDSRYKGCSHMQGPPA